MLKGKAPLPKKVKPPIEGLFCNYSHRACYQSRVEGYDYCIRHILEDRNSAYKQCNYVSTKNGKRCSNAAPKADKKDGYCAEHSRKATLMRQKASRKRQAKDTPESLLDELDRYSHLPSSSVGPGGDASRSDIALQKKSSFAHEGLASRILEFASDSESEKETILVDQAWRGDADSDAESIDSDQEDPLKHAGVYLAEEVTLITRDKLIKLQSLYIEQFRRLQHILKEKRRRYLATLRSEKETFPSIHNSIRKNKDEFPKYERLKAMLRYHKRHGKEALLQRRAREKRVALTEGQHYKPPASAKCLVVINGSRCTSQVLPLSKYCWEHILRDQHQILFQPCSNRCANPIIPISESTGCLLHTTLIPKLSDNRQDCKDDEDREIDITINVELDDKSTDSPQEQVIGVDV